MSYAAIFMAKRILDKKEIYEEVFAARPDLKEEIDLYLREHEKN